MLLSVWKYPLEVTYEQTITVPEGAQFLTVQIQNEVPCLWALVNPNTPTKPCNLLIIGTGHNVEAVGLYLGTFQLDHGTFIGHVFLKP